MLDADGNNITPSSRETIITVGYFDEDGTQHYSITRSSRPYEKMHPAGFAPMKQATYAFYAAMNCTVFSIQVCVEQTEVVAGIRPTPQLQLVKTIDRRKKPRNSGFGGI